MTPTVIISSLPVIPSIVSKEQSRQDQFDLCAKYRKVKSIVCVSLIKNHFRPVNYPDLWSYQLAALSLDSYTITISAFCWQRSLLQKCRMYLPLSTGLPCLVHRLGLCVTEFIIWSHCYPLPPLSNDQKIPFLLNNHQDCNLRGELSMRA